MTTWNDRLIAAIMRKFGQRRAFEDLAQVRHMSTMIELVENWPPASYPAVPPREPAVTPVNDASFGN
jgi:hypothetical protein